MVVKFDLSVDPIAKANPTTFEDFRILMASFRINMEESRPTTTNEYSYWRSKIKDLRVMAIERNIDAYELEVDVHYSIEVAKAKPLIEKYEAEVTAAQKKIAEALGKANYEKVKAEQEAIIAKARGNIAAKEMELRGGIPEERQVFFHNMVREAYIVKELVDLREQRERATTDKEKEVLASRAEALRLEGIAILQATGQNTQWQRDDLERRVWYSYLGYNIASPRFGEADTRTDEQKKIWAGHKALMDAAAAKFNSYDEATKKALIPEDEVWEQIRQKEDPIISSIWNERKYETFSGADMVVYFAFPGYKPIDIGLASLISYSMYREKKQIRTIGAINTRGITKGPRTISGRLVMTVVREHFVEALRREIPYMRSIRNILMDELPPFDILVSFGNEYGAAAAMVLHGVTFVDEQKTLTVEDMYTENIFTFLARDIDVMKTVFANYEDEYDPQMWMTSSFIPDGSEILGDFYPKDLELTQAANMLTDPQPFYGTVSGWNGELYDMLYTGVDSSSLTIDSSGNLVNDNTGGSSGDTGGGSSGGGTDNPSGDDDDYYIGTPAPSKLHPSSDFLWVKNPNTVADNKQVEYLGGWAGYMTKEVAAGFSIAPDSSKRLWLDHMIRPNKTKIKGDFEMFSTHEKLRSYYTEESLTLGSRDHKDNLKFTLQMFSAMKTEGTLKKKLLPTGTTDEDYYVELTWTLITPSGYKFPSGAAMHINSSDHHRERAIAVAGFWNREVPYTTLVKQMTASTSSTATKDQKVWVNTVSENKAQHGITTKDTKVGGIDATQKASYISTHGSHRIKADGTPVWIKISKHGTDIDLANYLWFVSTIGRTGNRYMLKFSDLPAGSVVIVRFKYNPNKPNTPTYSEGDMRFFYIVLTKSKDDVKRESTTFFKYMNPKGTYDQARWALYNKKDIEGKKK